MKTILIDDEKPALLQLERMLEADSRVQVTGKYTSARAGLDHLAREQTDLIFLDIGMPGMNGLAAAELIRRSDARVHIVYVTAYAEYAVEAFELAAFDYLLKPIRADRLAKTIGRLTHQNVEPEPSPVISEPTIRSFQRLEWRLAGEDGGLKWRTEKAQELFAFLLAHKGSWVSRDMVVESIWPDYAPERATNALHMAVYQVRQLLKHSASDATLEYKLGSYRLVGSCLITDVELFESLEPESEILSQLAWEHTDRLLTLYRGPYLAEHDYAWALPKRQQLQQLFVQASLQTAAYELRTERAPQAARRLSRLQQLEPYSGEICRYVLQAYAQQHDTAGLHAQYAAYCKALRAELGIKPDRRTQETYKLLTRR